MTSFDSNLETADSDHAWQECDRAPDLPAGHVHTWLISLECEPAELAELRGLLSDDERARCDRFLFERHRRRFAAGRARMRKILADYSGAAPDSIVFDYSDLGKPRLAKSRPGQGLCFNFSNSHERALLTVTHDVEIGVDLERIREMENLAGLAQRFFAEDEKEFILQQDDPLRTQAFFKCWTRKEAFLKAIGKGLTFPLCDVSVALRPEQPVAILDIKDDQFQPGDWDLRHLAAGEDYVGAIACQRSQNAIECFRHMGSSNPTA